MIPGNQHEVKERKTVYSLFFSLEQTALQELRQFDHVIDFFFLCSVFLHSGSSWLKTGTWQLVPTVPVPHMTLGKYDHPGHWMNGVLFLGDLPFHQTAFACYFCVPHYL